MVSFLVCTVALFAGVFGAAVPRDSVYFNGTTFQADNIIDRDVCIIGGGSSGTYSAVRLKDMGKSVVIIEKNNYLGGHAHSYADPATGSQVNLGVMEFDDMPVVHDYFTRLGVGLESLTTANIYSSSTSVDFRTGELVEGYPSYNTTQLSAALSAYLTQVEKYAYLDEGYNLPDPVPEDLLLPFGDFVKKYDLQAMMSVVVKYSQGMGDILQMPALYIVKVVNALIVRNILSGTFFQAGKKGVASVLYDTALRELGDDVLLGTTVSAGDRSTADSVKLVAQTRTGKKLIRAKKLIVTVPQKLVILRQFLDLDDDESAIFGQFTNSAYYTGLLQNTGIPTNISMSNVAVGTEYNYPVQPAIYGLFDTGVSGLYDVKFGGRDPVLDDSTVSNAIMESLAHLQATGAVSKDATGKIAALASHTPFQLVVSTAAIKNGFYKSLYGLQGKKDTWFTGAAFMQHDSSYVWNFTEALLPRVVESLG